MCDNDWCSWTGEVMENWEEAIDMLSATHSFGKPQGGVSIDNRIIKAVAMLISERDLYREALERYGKHLPGCEHLWGIGRRKIIVKTCTCGLDNALRGGEVGNE